MDSPFPFCLGQSKIAGLIQWQGNQMPTRTRTKLQSWTHTYPSFSIVASEKDLIQTTKTFGKLLLTPRCRGWALWTWWWHSPGLSGFLPGWSRREPASWSGPDGSWPPHSWRDWERQGGNRRVAWKKIKLILLSWILQRQCIVCWKKEHLGILILLVLHHNLGLL